MPGIFPCEMKQAQDAVTLRKRDRETERERGRDGQTDRKTVTEKGGGREGDSSLTARLALCGVIVRATM